MIKDRTIDLTEDKVFSNRRSSGSSIFLDFPDLFSRRSKFPWYIKAVCSGDTDTSHGLYYWNNSLSKEMGFNIYGELSNPFFTGNVSDMKDYAHTLEGYLVLDCNVETVCAHCGKNNTIFDRPYTRKALFDYYPPLCKKCYLLHKNVSALNRYKEQAIKNTELLN